MMRKPSAILVLLILSFLPCLAQKRQREPVCSQTTFAAFRRLPELNYLCPQRFNESDEEILKVPERIAALNKLAGELESFTNAAWWQARVHDLEACEVHGSAGELTNEERGKLKDGDYIFRLFGDHQFRLVLADDPCYQTGFSGSNAFLLYRAGAKLFVSQVLDGYYSRIDNSVGLDFADLNGQTLIEISTANNMPPEFTNYYL